MSIKTKKRTKPDRPNWAAKLAAKHTRPALYNFPLRTKTIAAPLQITEDGVFAWFILDPLNWEFMLLDERRNEHDGQSSRWGQLAEQFGTPEGRPFHERRTMIPFAAYKLAAQLDSEADPIDGVDWNEYLKHLQARLRSTGLDQRMSAVGLWIADVPSDEAIADLSEVGGVEHPRKEAVDILNRYAETAAAMAGGAMRGVPATPEDMSFLMHRSLSMGLPAPTSPGFDHASWDEDGLGEFQNRSTWVAQPFGDHVRIVGDVEGVHSERYVAVLSSGIMPEKVWPESGEDGWLMAMDRLGFPVEASVKGVLKTGSQVESDAVFNLRRTKATDHDYRVDHRMDPPESVARAIQSAKITHDEVTAGNTRTAPRAVATVRWAVYGTTLEEVNERARKVVVFAKDKLRFPLTRTTDQARELRGFVPGEPDVPNGFERRLTMGYLSAGMPNIDAQVGTPTGFYLGYTSLSKRAVLFDPHWAMANNMPGLYTIAGEPGSGKSFLTGTMAYNMRMAGVRVVVWDPSGPLAALTRMPELASTSAELNLARADEGTMSPHQMIATPVRDHFREPDGAVDELEYQRAVKMARAERTQLAFDTLRGFLPAALLRVRGVDQTLTRAIRAMAGQARPGLDETMFNLRWAVDHLGSRTKDDLARELWAELNEAAEFPGVSTAIPSHRDPVEDIGLPDKGLVVVTLPGIAAPSGNDEDGDTAERYSKPLIHLSAFFSSRFIYSRPRDEKKALMLDEGDMLIQLPSGRRLVRRVTSDTRKHHTAAFFSDQEASTMSLLGKRMESLTGGGFVGRLRNREAAERACQMLGVSPMFAPVIQGLRTGEFVMVDPLRRHAKYVGDKDWHPSLAALDTTPKGRRSSYTLDLPPAPVLDPRLFGEDTPSDPVTVPLPVANHERNAV